MSPDLTTVTRRQCEASHGPKSFEVGGTEEYQQHGLFSERHVPFCSCKSYEFSKAEPRWCKHLQKIIDETCPWHQVTHKAPVNLDNTCPLCGGPTVQVEVAV